MIRILIGLGLVAGATYAGRRRRGPLEAPPKLDPQLVDVLNAVEQFALQQYPRVNLAPGDDPRYEDAGYKIQCDDAEADLDTAAENMEELARVLENQEVVTGARVLVDQAYSAAAQPRSCHSVAVLPWLK